MKITPLMVLVVLLPAVRAHASDEVRFGRDVLPILSDRCFNCHGPDEGERKAGLRLDDEQDAKRQRDGYFILKPGDPAESELWRRITSEDEKKLMPPRDSHRKPLTAAERNVIRRWIEQGSKWGKHWSFEKPQRPPVPGIAEHPVDAFVQTRLAKEGLPPSPPAPDHTQVRRLFFDLNGLPPTMDVVDAFVKEPSDANYNRLVDQLLQSPHYGERMAMWWLDAARYSDTDGYQQDETRTNWPWRDWVIDAFNNNMKFDQFTIEQFAGDLLPNATNEQTLATAFHRNHMTNGEGGRHPEESRIDYVIDRVNTTGTVFLGLTLGCAQCHSHKFDPISQKDYYSFFAYFDSIDEDGKAGKSAKPYLDYKSPYVQESIEDTEQLVAVRRQALEASRQQARSAFQPWLAAKVKETREGFKPWRPLAIQSLATAEGTVLKQEADGAVQASGPNPFQDDYVIIATSDLDRITGLRLEVLPHDSHTDGKLSRGDNGEFILTDVKLQVRRRGATQLRDVEIARAIADAEGNDDSKDYGKVADTLDDDPRNGWTTQSHDARKSYRALFELARPLYLAEDEELIFIMLHRSTRGDSNIGRFRVSVTDQAAPALRTLDPMPLEQLAKAKIEGDADVDGDLRSKLLEQFLADHEAFQKVKAAYDRAKSELNRFRNAAGDLKVMVLHEREKPRTTYILERGVWDKKGAVVTRSVPGVVLDWPAEQVTTRLDFARWIVSKDNPLTARVIVNQLWQNCFGAGLVRTPSDFGLQGELPTHPELLDWLAVELMENDWDIQHILRLIVTSQTYRQSSVIDSTMRERDPENRLLARGARYRLPSWMIRDAALRAAGIMNENVGGPPVMPYQPEGIWAEMFMGRFRYRPSQGDAQYRRTLYAFWRRAAAPTFLFDSAQRRVCEVTPRLTNTPLHALTLMNDLNILEASRELARQIIAAEGSTDARLTSIFQRIVSRSPNKSELEVLRRELNRAKQHYQSHLTDAESLLDFGQPEWRDATDAKELASYMIVSSIVFNLDEAITHE